MSVAEVRQHLERRAAVLAAIRTFFVSRGSVEVETPAIVRSPGVDAQLDAIEVHLRIGGDPLEEPLKRWLATSPEYHMKRLLAAGSGPIHQLGKAWRDGEVGRLHEPEFTLLEWYRPGIDDAGMMDECEALVRELSQGFASAGLRSGKRGCDPEATFERITYREAFERHAGLDPSEVDDRRLGRLLRAAGTKPPRDSTHAELEDLVLALVVQPELGQGRPTFVTDWPCDRAALARIRPGRDADGAPSAARFELYACGLELCNGYHELSDADEQRSRIQTENAARQAAGKPPYPIDEDFLAALAAGLPDCSGNALGIDRLLLCLFGGEDLSESRSFRLDITKPPCD